MEDITINEPGMVCIGEPAIVRMVRDAEEALKLTDEDIAGIYQRMEKQVDLIIAHYRTTGSS